MIALDASPSAALLSSSAPFEGPPALTPIHHVLGLRAEAGGGAFEGDLPARVGPFQIKLDIDLATPADPAVEQLGPVPVLAGGPPTSSACAR